MDKAEKLNKLTKLGRICKTVMLFAILTYAVCGFYTAWHAFHGEHFVEAAGRGDIATVESCLDRGMNPNTDRFKGSTAMEYAVDSAHKPYDKYLRIATILLDHGSDPNEALEAAVHLHKPEFAQLAISRGADVNKKLVNSWDLPLSDAAKNHDMAMVKLLKRYGAHR